MKTRFYAGLTFCLLAVGGSLWLLRKAPDTAPAVTASTPVVSAPARQPLAPVPPPASLSPLLTKKAAPKLTPAVVPPAETPSEFSEFRDWTQRFAAATDKDRLRAEGITLATARRAALATLIRENPEQALALALPWSARKDLPAEVTALLEERISGIGELALLASTPLVGQPATTAPLYRAALIGRREFRAYTYGRRQKSTRQLPAASLHGIALDGDLAVSDSPVRILEPGEPFGDLPVEPVCSISGELAAAPAKDSLTVAADVGGRIQFFCDPDHAKTAAHNLAFAENNAADDSPGSSTVTGRPSYAWTHGTKKVLVIRVDFPDFVGTPTNFGDGQAITEDYIVNAFNGAGGVRDFYQQNSFGQTALLLGAATGGDSPDVTGVLRMPTNANYYAASNFNTLLHSDARNAAQNAGFNVSGYDRIGVVFSRLSSRPNSKITYAGLGNLNGPNFWINSYFDLRVVGHEIGHNYGLNHASFREVTDGNPVSSGGTTNEYGDPFDIMGSGSDITHHFSHWNKSILQWIPDEAVTTISTSGTYRVYRFDDQSANLTHPLALKVVRDATHDYWIGHRRATSNSGLDNGAYILWGFNENTYGELLDMTTPGTTPNDAALAVGVTFNDTNAGIALRPTARGGSGADEWLDVQVTFQPRIQWEQSIYLTDENGGTAVLTVTRNNNSSGTVSVNYNTVGITASAPGDYTATNGTLTWNNGDMSPKTVSISLVNDGVAEGLEYFGVRLTNITGGVIAGTNLARVILAEPGTSDATMPIYWASSTVYKVLPLPDGSTLIGGAFDQLQDESFALYDQQGYIRLRPDGYLDQEFTGGGGVIGPFGQLVRDIALQTDGKILLAGNFTNLNGVTAKPLARLNSDGSLDSSFNVGGAGPNGAVHAVIAQPDGKILIGGAFTSYNGTAREYIARLHANGTLDTSFVGPDFAATSTWRINSLALQPDNKILAAGVFYFSGSPFKAGLCRLDSNGTLDSTFNGVTQGAHAATNTSTLLEIRQVVPLNDGKILIAGMFSAYNNVGRSGLARLTSTGSLDTGFVPTNNGYCSTVLVQPDGKLLVGGTFTVMNGAIATNFARLQTNGTLDTSFNAAAGPDAEVRNMTLRPDGRVVMGTTGSGYFQSLFDGAFWHFFPGLPARPGTIQWSADAFAGVEGTSALLTATRTGGSGGALSVNYATVAGSATNTDFTATNGTLTWANGETNAKTVTIPITADVLADSGETFAVNLGPALMESTLLGTTRKTTVTVTTGFGAWQATNFTTLELANAAISGDAADPDGDGLANVVEYAGGFSPHVYNSNSLSSSKILKISNTNFLTLTYRRRTPAPDLSFVGLTAANLSTNLWLTNAVLVGSPTNNGDGTESITLRDALPATNFQRYLRMGVSRTP